MCALDQRGIGPPSCRLEGSGAEEVLVERNKSFAYTIGDLGQVAGSKLVGD